MNTEKKALGVGSLALLFFLVGVTFSGTTINRKELIEHLSDFLGFSIAEGLIVIGLLILSIIVGIKYKEHLFAKIGAILSAIILSLLVIFQTISWIQNLFS
ncbi:hypothetical protein SH601_02060 [Gracilibacillus sp. S3-1-1]|uniref:Uncharacterized protein n=1 Tax=Gracilibacillus pellucidus TaxID=3095368 RepID=A0ACC6M1E3_9BACI|nr:hypothetical protein [Gracilibacillus sp. S3-1-1]MDX8044759.1 hypothetical protein [Gracilibacillus sp. S3-1-1]